MSRVLVVSPHPDDETIGCGGTLRAHVVRKDTVRVIFLTSGERGSRDCSLDEARRIREEEAAHATALLGIRQREFWRQPDGALHATSAVVERLRQTFLRWRPSIVYVTHAREQHPDHRAACRIVQQAAAHLPRTLHRPMLLMSEVWTPLQQIDVITDVSPFMNKKLSAVRAYKSQCARMRFDEAVRSLNRYRGEMHSWPGGDYAEVFERLL